jgi:hypothetical protein
MTMGIMMRYVVFSAMKVYVVLLWIVGYDAVWSQPLGNACSNRPMRVDLVLKTLRVYSILARVGRPTGCSIETRAIEHIRLYHPGKSATVKLNIFFGQHILLQDTSTLAKIFGHLAGSLGRR